MVVITQMEVQTQTRLMSPLQQRIVYVFTPWVYRATSSHMVATAQMDVQTQTRPTSPPNHSRGFCPRLHTLSAQGYIATRGGNSTDGGAETDTPFVSTTAEDSVYVFTPWVYRAASSNMVVIAQMEVQTQTRHYSRGLCLRLHTLSCRDTSPYMVVTAQMVVQRQIRHYSRGLCLHPQALSVPGCIATHGGNSADGGADTDTPYVSTTAEDSVHVFTPWVCRATSSPMVVTAQMEVQTQTRHYSR